MRDTKGESHLTKFAKPVGADAENVEIVETAKAGAGEVRTGKQRTLMKPFVDQLSKHIGSGKEMTLTNAGIFLRGLPNFSEKAREAGINQKGLIANILRLFPQFKVLTGAQGGTAAVKVAPKRRLPVKRAVS